MQGGSARYPDTCRCIQSSAQVPGALRASESVTVIVEMVVVDIVVAFFIFEFEMCIYNL